MLSSRIMNDKAKTVPELTLPASSLSHVKALALQALFVHFLECYFTTNDLWT